MNGVGNERLTKASRRDNNFDALRLSAALLVVIGHAFVLTSSEPAPRLAGVPIHTVGLYVFFIISGYLITDSWLRTPRVGSYLFKRCLRIFPALIVIVVVTVLILGPLLSSLPAGAYFADPQTSKYLLNLTLFAQYDLPGVFDIGHRSTAVNGVLWTLGLEFACYLLIAAAGVLARRLRTPSVRVLLMSIFTAVAFGCTLIPTLPSALTWLSSAGAIWVFFAIGALARELIHVRFFQLRWAFVATVAWLALGAAWPGGGWLFSVLLLPYISLAVALRPISGVRSAARFGDVSYGTYLWGFLVQQVVMEMAPGLAFGANLALVITSTVLISLLSWHLVERRALSLGRVRAHPTLARSVVFTK